MPIPVIWFCSWMLKLCILITQWIMGFDQFMPPKTSLFTVTNSQRYLQLDYGVKPVPQKRSRKEITFAWIRSLDENDKSDNDKNNH
jgi:hypothetical protein